MRMYCTFSQKRWGAGIDHPGSACQALCGARGRVAARRENARPWQTHCSRASARTRTKVRRVRGAGAPGAPSNTVWSGPRPLGQAVCRWGRHRDRGGRSPNRCSPYLRCLARGAMARLHVRTAAGWVHVRVRTGADGDRGDLDLEPQGDACTSNGPAARCISAQRLKNFVWTRVAQHEGWLDEFRSKTPACIVAC